MKKDILMRAVSFNLPGAGNDNTMDIDSFNQNVIKNKTFTEKLRIGLIKGLLTHEGRNYADASTSPTPYEDIITKHPDLCNAMVTCDIKKDSAGHSAYCWLNLLDGLPAAELVKTHVKNGMYVGCSMATRSEFVASDKKFYIQELLGLDITWNPYFISTGLVKSNFSADAKSCMVNFSNAGSSVVATSGDFAGTPIGLSLVEEDGMHNFNLRDRIREWKKPIYLVLATRIRDTIMTLKSLNDESIKTNADVIINYIEDIMYYWLAKRFGEEGRINVQIDLRISQFLDDQTVLSRFNSRINILKNMYKSQDWFVKISQSQLKDLLSELYNSLWRYITKKAGVEFDLLMKTTAQSETQIRVK